MLSYKRNAVVFASIVAFGSFVFGLDAALISGTVKFITAEFGLTDAQLGTVVGAPAAGVLWALLFAGWVSNRFGRKRAIQVVSILYLVSAVGSALAPNFWTLVVARFLGGLAFTSISLASMYIGEIAPPKWRGKLVTMIQINIVVGLSAAYFINYFILKLAGSGTLAGDPWRWMLGSEIPFTVLWFVLLLIIPESPAWFLYRNRIDGAKHNLKKIMPADEIDSHIEEMRESLKLDTKSHSIPSQLKELFSRPMRLVMIIAVTIAIAQQATGINAILFYAPTVIEQLGLGTDAAFMQAIWIGLVSVIATVVSIYTIDRLGRRPMLLGGMLWIIISLMVCTIGFKGARYTLTGQAVAEMTSIPHVERLNSMVGVEYRSDIELKQALAETLGEEDARAHSSLVIQKSAKMNAGLIFAGILSFIAAFQYSVGPVMWVLFSEIFPIALRGIAIPLVTLITSFVSWVVQVLFPIQMASQSIGSIFMTYAAVVGIGLIILFKTVKETKNLSLEQIQQQMRVT